jgi:hypothetical protein
MMQNDISPSQRSKDVNCRDQESSSSTGSARYKHVSTWGTSRETQSGAPSNEQHDQKGAEPVEEPWESLVKRLPSEMQDIIIKERLGKDLVNFLCEDLLNRHNRGSYIDQIKDMLDILSEIGSESATKELVKQLGQNEDRRRFIDGCIQWEGHIQLMILHAIEISGDRSVMQELIEKSYDVKDNDKVLRAAYYGTIGILGGRSELANMLSSRQVEGIAKYSLEWAVKLSENPSAGQELTQELANVLREGNYDKYSVLSHLAGKFGDVSVARELVQELGQLSHLGDNTINYISKICGTIGDISRRLDNPAEIKELSDILVKIAYKDNTHPTSLMDKYYLIRYGTIGTITKLGQRLAKLVGQKASTSEGQELAKREDVKKLSKDLVHMLMLRDDIGGVVVECLSSSSIANGVFKIEQCLVEPSPFARFLHREEVNRKVFDEIAKELVEYRQGNQSSESFDRQLVEIVFDPSVIGDMRYATAHSFGKINNPSAISHQLKQKFSKDFGMMDNYVYKPILDAIRNVENESFVSELFKVISPTRFKFTTAYLNDKERNDEKMAEQISQLSTQVSNVEEFVEKLTDKRIAGPTRKVMARLIGIVGKPSLVPKLVEMLSKGKIDREVCEGIADAIGKLGQKLVEPAEIKEFCGELVDVLPKTNENTRSKLISVIEELGDESIASKLAEKLSNREIDRSVRQEMLQLAERLLLLRC